MHKVFSAAAHWAGVGVCGARFAMGVTLLVVSFVASARLVVVDDVGLNVVLAAPAQRIASLAPHATELLFAAGAGAQVIAVGAFSDYPAPASTLPVVSDAFAINVEALLALKPDVVVLWQSGSSPKQREQLRALGVPVFMSEPRRLEDVASSIERLGQLAGTASVAQTEATRLRREIARLRSQYSDAAPVRVLFAMGERQLMTLNDQHFVSDVIRLCGGVNVFGSNTLIAPQIDTEAIVAARPEVVIRPAARGDRGVPPSWKKWPIEAARQERFASIDADSLLRPTARLIAVAPLVCAAITSGRTASFARQIPR
jgi:iron complex transport system substrate-binding protein